MPTRPNKPNVAMDPNVLTTLKEIKAQLNTLGQRMDKIENDRRDRVHSGERQHNPCREDRTPRNHDRFEDGHYLKNIKLEVSNFDGRLDPQYYLDWIISLE